MTPVRIADPDEGTEMLRPDVDDWRGPEIRSLLEIRGLLEAGEG
jgi:hypothetical protein